MRTKPSRKLGQHSLDRKKLFVRHRLMPFVLDSVAMGMKLAINLSKV